MTNINPTSSSSDSSEPLLVLTDSAVEKVKTMMAREDKDGFGLRVGVVTGGCAGLSYDMRFQKNPYDNDVVIQQGELRIISIRTLCLF